MVKDGAAAALFPPGIVGRIKRRVLWRRVQHDIFALTIDRAELAADRVIYMATGDYPNEPSQACRPQTTRGYHFQSRRSGPHIVLFQAKD